MIRNVLLVYMCFLKMQKFELFLKKIIRYDILCNILHNYNTQQYIVTTNVERLLIKQLSCASALS